MIRVTSTICMILLLMYLISLSAVMKYKQKSLYLETVLCKAQNEINELRSLVDQLPDEPEIVNEDDMKITFSKSGMQFYVYNFVELITTAYELNEKWNIQTAAYKDVVTFESYEDMYKDYIVQSA